jgi:hypothetical protein
MDDKNRCVICKKALHDGIIINGRMICKSCEKRLLESKMDTDFYEYYKECLKKVICNAVVNEEGMSS